MKNNIQLIGFLTMFRKEVNRVFRIWRQTLLPPVITMTLYFLIFGKFIGNRVGSMQGFSYIEFIVPGLIMMSIITNSFGNVVSAVFGSRFQKNIEEVLISPLRKSVLLLGFLSGGIVRGFLVGMLVVIVSMFFAPIKIYHWGIFLFTTILTTLLFGLGGFINSVFAKRFDDINLIPIFVLTPLTYLGGVFYSIKMLPEFWQNVSLLNPVLYLVNVYRYAFLGISDINVYVALGCVVFVVVLLWLAALKLLNRDLRLG